MEKITFLDILDLPCASTIRILKHAHLKPGHKQILTAQISVLTNLEEIQIWEKGLQGPIPEELYALPKQPYLAVR